MYAAAVAEFGRTLRQALALERWAGLSAVAMLREGQGYPRRGPRATAYVLSWFCARDRVHMADGTVFEAASTLFLGSGCPVFDRPMPPVVAVELLPRAPGGDAGAF